MEQTQGRVLIFVQIPICPNQSTKEPKKDVGAEQGSILPTKYYNEYYTVTQTKCEFVKGSTDERYI